jgi:hypothetical protein
MADAVVLEFDGVGRDDYDRVNKELGVDMTTGEGNWPAGLQMHSAGLTDDGTFLVYEVWESREAQATFMHDRLGAALAAGGVTAQPAVTWVSLFTYQAHG